MRRLVLFLSATLLALPAFAQSYPSKPLRMILAFPPGGPTDINARIFALKLGESMGQQIVVDNRPGAGGNIAAAEAARAPADGYTIFYNTSAISIAPSLYSRLNYDVTKDYAPVALTATVPLVLVVNPALPVKNVQDLVAYSRANPAKMNYGSSGSGTITHLAGALFATQMGLEMQHIPYKGSAPALVDVAGGQTQMMIDTINTVLPYVRDNRLRALAIAITRRSAALPDVPTLEEAAKLPGFEMSAWQGIVVPAATPKDIVVRLNAEINKAVQNADLRQRLAAQGAEPLGGTSEHYAAYIRSELGRWTKVVKDSGAKADSDAGRSYFGEPVPELAPALAPAPIPAPNEPLPTLIPAPTLPLPPALPRTREIASSDSRRLRSERALVAALERVSASARAFAASDEDPAMPVVVSTLVCANDVPAIAANNIAQRTLCLEWFCMDISRLD